MHNDLPIKKILIAIDFSDAARRAFYTGINMATKLGAETWVLHVSEPIRSFDFAKKRYVETAETIERVQEGVARRVDELWSDGRFDSIDRRDVHVLVRGGKAPAEIVATARAREIDLIVLGSSNSGSIGSALGSTSEKVARNAHCSVLCVRGRDDAE
jgi:nucleotide-binding universal stress UspA family protein